MDFAFPPELEKFREEVREFIRTEVPPGFEGVGMEEEDPKEAQGIRRKLAHRGWLTMAWPKEYGGMEAPHYQQMVFNEEMAYHRVPAVDNSVNMLGPILMMEGTDEQKREFLPRIARAEMRWGQGYSEPGSGSDLASLQTRAVADGDDFVINGTKIWTSGAHNADWLFMLARTDQEAP
ncbi:MAG: acyl-CoA dehydrogenase family protein [Chloroflexi bacterium]|nr:acyl-CoA dehydrogenase family protein [Chloroflexota bacterium]